MLVDQGRWESHLPNGVSSYDWPDAAGSGSERKTPSENAQKSSAFKGVSHPLRSERESNIFRSPAFSPFELGIECLFKFALVHQQSQFALPDNLRSVFSGL
jgi:hypothetical protein